jgi:hypothetical protein
MAVQKNVQWDKHRQVTQRETKPYHPDKPVLGRLHRFWGRRLVKGASWPQSNRNAEYNRDSKPDTSKTIDSHDFNDTAGYGCRSGRDNVKTVMSSSCPKA